MLSLSFVVGVGLSVSSLTSVPAQQPIVRSDGQYLLLDAKKTAALQAEVDKAAAKGYRVRFGNAAYNLLILEQATSDPNGAFRVLDDLKKQLKELSNQGFRVIPSTLSAIGDRMAAVVVKTPPGTNYEYLLVETSRTATLEKEINQGIQKAFRPIGLVSGEDHHAAVLEKSADPASPGTDTAADVKLLATSKSSTLQQELADHAAQGYHVLFGTAAKETLVFMQKRTGTPAEYRVLATTKSSSLQDELNEAAAGGFRLLPSTMTAVQKRLGFMGTYGYEIGVIMEKTTDSGPRPDYLVLGTKRVSTLAKELGKAAADGYRVLGMMLSYEEQVMILERSAQPATTKP